MEQKDTEKFREQTRENQQSSRAYKKNKEHFYFFARFSASFFVANEIQFNVHLHAAKSVVGFSFFTVFFFCSILCFIECERLTNHRTGRRGSSE